MVAAYVELPAGTDLGPLLKGLPGDACTCPHWGFLIKGQILVGNVGEKDERLEAGQLFYLHPGHTAKVDKDAAFVEFSPEGQYNEVLEHVLEKVTAAN